MKRIVFKDEAHSNRYDSSVLNDFYDSDSDKNANDIKNESINNNDNEIKNESINNNDKMNENNLQTAKQDISSSKDNSVSNPKANTKPWNKWAMQAADSFDWNVFTFSNKYKSVKSTETTLPTDESFDDNDTDNDSDKDEEELNF